MNIPEFSKNPLQISRAAQYRTVEELIEKSKPTFNYYALLVLSTVIISAGLLLNNVAIVIGGMLVTPLLTPLLAVALGISVGEISLISRISRFMLQSFLFVAIGGFIMGLIFPVSEITWNIGDTSIAALLYLIVAFASGIAATFAWIQKEVSAALPGIAIAVSLVPPIALVGIGFGKWQLDIAASYFVVFLLNLVGILAGSLIVFSMSKFNRSERKIKEKNEEVVVETHLKKLGKKLEKEEQEEKINSQLENNPQK